MFSHPPRDAKLSSIDGDGDGDGDITQEPTSMSKMVVKGSSDIGH